MQTLPDTFVKRKDPVMRGANQLLLNQSVECHVHVQLTTGKPELVHATSHTHTTKKHCCHSLNTKKDNVCVGIMEGEISTDALMDSELHNKAPPV